MTPITVANRLEVYVTYIFHIIIFILLIPLVIVDVLFYGWVFGRDR